VNVSPRVAQLLAALAILAAVSSQAATPAATTDPEHPFARELVSIYEAHYDVALRGDVAAARRMAAARPEALDAGSLERLPGWLVDLLGRWLLKLAAVLMQDPQTAQFVAVDVAESRDASRLIYLEPKGTRNRFFAAIFMQRNGAWFVVRTVSRTNQSTVREGLGELRSETDTDLCPAEPQAGESSARYVSRTGSEETGYRVSCGVVRTDRDGVT
jgi:hypothetical protein